MNSISKPFLYGDYQISYPMENNIFYSFAQRFKRDNDLESIKSLILYTSQIATNYNTPLDEMYFGEQKKKY